MRWVGLLPGTVNPRWLRCLSTKCFDGLGDMPLEKEMVEEKRVGENSGRSEERGR